mmetsp:Transcript_769/g.2075  ORF Transcript_769/g.2075 Transcript_769/m.2075 type:complete len:84 (-) Transcript_769:828-1079(-)
MFQANETSMDLSEFIRLLLPKDRMELARLNAFGGRAAGGFAGSVENPTDSSLSSVGAVMLRATAGRMRARSTGVEHRLSAACS